MSPPRNFLEGVKNLLRWRRKNGKRSGSATENASG